MKSSDQTENVTATVLRRILFSALPRRREEEISIECRLSGGGRMKAKGKQIFGNFQALKFIGALEQQVKFISGNNFRLIC